MKNIASPLALFCAVIAMAFVVHGCAFDPPNGLLICAASGKACPDGYECNDGDHRCYKKGTGPKEDMTVPLDMAKVVKLQGQGCDQPNETCEGSLVCTDGVCCENACADPCKACNVDGNLGNCVPVPAGEMPRHSTCNKADVSTCGHDGTCDGAGTCALYPAGTDCGAGSCNTGTGAFQPAPECDGKGVCQTLAGYNCDPYKCADATSCFGPTCTSTTQCSGTNTCTNMSGGLLMNGRMCTMGNQCLSGFCADGVCCNVACNGQCAACDIPDAMGNKGTCSQVMGAPRAGHTACAGTGLCAGTCGSQMAACDYPTSATQCSTSCKDAVTVNLGLCNGAGACSVNMMTCANNLACVGTSCKTMCNLDTDCDSRYFCNTSSHVCVSKCTNMTQDNGESDIDCGGPNCAKCPADRSCNVNGDCVSNVCSNPIMGKCRQAVGPPGWDALSNASMPYGRAMHQMVTSKGKIYALGGTEWYTGSGSTRDSQSYAVYTPSYLTSANGIGSWAVVDSSLPAATIDPAAITLSDGTIHIMGGWYHDLSDSQIATHGSMLPPATTFTTGTSLNTALSGLRAAIASDGFTYLIGGGTVPGLATACVNQVTKFTPPNTFTAQPSMGAGGQRCNFALAPTVDGRLYAFFGRNANNGTTGLTGYASWKPGDANWVVNAGGISGMGYNNTGALGSDGRIYLLGGETGGAGVATDRQFIKYNEAAGFIFMPAFPGGFPISRAAATQGPDGRIWMTGGVTTVSGSPTPIEFTYVWGPHFTVSTVTPAKGGTTLATLKNFAATAIVSVYLDSTATTALAVTPAATDASGNFAGTLTVTIPAATTSGPHKLIAMDPKSEYPVYVPITIP